MRFSTLALALASGVALPCVAAAAVVNGDFEDTSSSVPDPGEVNGNSLSGLTGTGTSSWDVFDSIPGWTTTSGAGIEVQTDGTLDTIDAHSGDHYVELDSHPNDPVSSSNSQMQQTVNLGVGTYRLSFWYSPRTNTADDNGIEYSIGSLLNGIADGPGVGPPPTAVGMWTEYVGIFDVTTADDYALSFLAGGTANTLGGFIDTVSISAVPLPASLLLLAGGLGGLGVFGRRRKV